METPLTLFQEFEKEKEQLAGFYELEILNTEPYPDYDNIVKLACYICDAPVALLSLADKTRIWFKDNVRWEDEHAPKQFPDLNSLQNGVMIEVHDTLLDDRFNDHMLTTQPPHARFYVEVPLIAADDTRLGGLCIMDHAPKVLSPDQRNALRTLARQIIIQLELKLQKRQLRQLNTRLLKDMERRIEQKDKILSLFSRFVPPEVITGHIQGEVGGFPEAELKHCAILFCDIRGYTSLVENESPGKAMRILNIFYTIMSDVIKEYSGMVVQYVGDEIFAIFGKPFSLPGYERNAVLCAIEMMNQLSVVNDLCKEIIPEPVKIGIGINAGEVITGTLGSDVKIEFCVTGNHVNTAKRIESLTQEKPDTILISETVYEQVKDMVNVVSWGPINVKGRTDPLQVYEVADKKSA